MANEKKGINKHIFILAGMGVAGVLWVIYMAPYATRPLPEASMPVVFNTSYDGSVWQITAWLKKHAYDYASLKMLHWGKVVDVKGGFTVHVKFKAKSRSGTYVISDKVFELDKSGHIIGMMDFNSKKH